MKKDLGIYIYLGIAIIALYITTKTYKNFSLDKSISACVMAQLKLKKILKAEDAKKYCEKEIKVKKNK